MDDYRFLLTFEAVERQLSIGGLVSAYADAGLRYLQQHVEADRNPLELFAVTD
jgi:hypothetical protein